MLDGDDASSAISPDGKKLAYSTNKDGPYVSVVRDLVTGNDQRLHEATAEYHCGVAWSADGTHLTFAMPPDTQSRRDVWVVDVLEGGVPGVLRRPGRPAGGEFSPNGKWLAYVSDESGQREVYVRTFPGGQLNLQVTFGGGDWPQWSPAGDRLYFRNKGKLYSVPFSPDDGPPAAALPRVRPPLRPERLRPARLHRRPGRPAPARRAERARPRPRRRSTSC